MMLESFIWLFLVVFVLHEFEEILTMETWLKRHRDILEHIVPKRIKPVVLKLANSTTPVFTAVIMEEFILLAIATLAMAEWALYDLFAALVLGYFIHILIHGAQAIYLRRYIPGLYFGFVSGAYSLYVLIYFGRLAYVDWSKVWVLTPILLIIMGLNLFGGHLIAERIFNPEVEDRIQGSIEV